MESRGTVTIVKNSIDVVGSGTNFDSTMEGKYFKIIGNDCWYLILTVTDTENIILDRNYRGESASGQYYELGDSQMWKDVEILENEETDAGKFNL